MVIYLEGKKITTFSSESRDFEKYLEGPKGVAVYPSLDMVCPSVIPITHACMEFAIQINRPDEGLNMGNVFTTIEHHTRNIIGTKATNQTLGFTVD